MTLFIGLDPGLDGALVALHDDGLLGAWRTREAFTAPTGKGTRRDYRPGEMAATLRLLVSERPSLAVLERQSAMPGQGVSSMFSIGVGFGLWMGILAALQIPTQLVQPQTWAKEMLRGTPGEGKARAIHAAGRLLPSLDMCPGKLRKPHSGLADAALLALYAQRIMGKGGT